MTDQTPAPVRRGRGRRPAGQVRHAVLAAAAAILFDGGLTAVTFDKVAARAGASKMTLYKWWPSPGALALEAYSTAVQDTLAFTDTGDLTRDLTAQLHAFIHLLTHNAGGRVIGELIGAAQTDPDLAAAFSTSYTRPRRQLAVDRLTAAQHHGQIHPDLDLEVLVDQLWGACYHRLLLPDQPLDTTFTDALVHNLLQGIQPHPNPRRTIGQPRTTAPDDPGT